MINTEENRLKFKRKVTSEFLRVRKYLVGQMIKNEFSVEEISFSTCKAFDPWKPIDGGNSKLESLQTKNNNSWHYL